MIGSSRAVCRAMTGSVQVCERIQRDNLAYQWVLFEFQIRSAGGMDTEVYQHGKPEVKCPHVVG